MQHTLMLFSGFQCYPGKAKINLNIPSASPSSTGEQSSLKSSPSSSMSPGNSIKKSPGMGTTISTPTLVAEEKKVALTPTPATSLELITIRVNKSKCSRHLGPYLDPNKVSHLPEQYGKGPIHKVVRESVQKLVDASLDQKEVFGMLRQGEGRVIITASFEDKIQKVRLPAMDSETAVKDFFEILFEELRCEAFYEVFKDDFDPEDEPLKNGLLKRKSSNEQVTLTFSNSMPTLTAATTTTDPGPSSGSSSSTTPKIPRLSSMDTNTFYNGKSKTNSKVMSYHQQQRPRGRPPGAKNKVPPEAKAKSPKHVPSSPSRPNNPAAVSPKVSKSGPIYQNAYKMHLEQEKAKALEAAMRSEPEIVPSPQPPILNPEEVPKDPTLWTIDHVISYISDLDPTLYPHVEVFRSQEIDGNALLLLTQEMMMKYMGMKLGPALKICNIINKLLGKKYQPIPKP